MAFEDLAPGAASWRIAGLRYILMPDAQSANRARVTGAPRFQPPRAPVPQRAFPPRGSVQPPRPQAAPKPAVPTPAPQQHFPPLEQWPPIWRERLAKTKRGLVCWTYRELGADLLALAVNEEGARLRKKRRGVMAWLLGNLGHPAGTHIFWPPGLAPDLTLEPDYFWGGLKLLCVKCLLVFGSGAARPLMEKSDIAPGQRFYKNGATVFILADLAAMNSQSGAQALQFLRAATAPYIRR